MKSRKNLTRFTYETTAFQGWRMCIARGGTTFTKYFSDKEYGGERKALKAAEEALEGVKDIIVDYPRWRGGIRKDCAAKVNKYLASLDKKPQVQS